MRPSARNAWGATWQTSDGLIWMFGGYGIDALGKTGALNDLWSFDPATKQWTWVSGDSLVDQFSHYGMRGVPSKNNKPGGRYGSASGTDTDGQFYLYSGYGSHASSTRGGFLNDVWRFNPKEKAWTWIGGDTLINQRGDWGTRGVAASGNKPDARYQGAGYVDGKNFYVFGGKGGGRGPECYSCLYNDLWKYDIDANQWTWLGGDNDRNQQGSYGEKGVEDPQSKPGARDGVVMSVYQGRIYVFGGLGLNNGNAERFNDLWRFDPASMQWTWISGDRKGNERGLYGPKGVSNTNSHPGARDGANAGFDQRGDFYVFGGTGFDKNGKLSQLNDLWTYDFSVDKWTWVSGDDQIRGSVSYGLQGVPSGANTPGARCYAAHWFDKKNNLWLFGGILQSYEGSAREQYSDLWMFRTNTKEWTWVSGEKKVNDAGSYNRNDGTGSIELGARTSGAKWTDKSGNLWFFGGLGTSPGNRPEENSRYGDLWKYDVASNSWSFVKGDPVPNTFGFGAKGQASPENRPRSREGAVSWVDKEGDLWLFGGLGLVTNTARGNGTDLGQLNDLWEYNIRSNQWNWVGGDTTGNNKGIYGTSGSGSRAFMPGSRMEAAGWTDAQDNFWLFGGLGYDVNSNKEGLLNDLWKFNPGTKEWTWVSGHKVSDQPSVYRERGVPAGSNHPGSRHNAMYWSDGNGLWLFGGYGIDAARNGGGLNDLWRYDITANSWTWLGGDTIKNSKGQYGTKGKALSGNWPGSRTAGAAWFDGHDLWLFGGAQAPEVSKQFNDLWRYNPETGFWTWVSGDNTINNGSRFGTKGSFAPGNMPGSRAATATWTTSGRFWMFGGSSYHATGSIHDRNNELWAFVPSPCTGLTATITPLLDSVYCPNDSVTLTASGGTSYQWLLNDTAIAGATAVVYQAKKGGVYQAIVYSGTSCHTVTRKATVHVAEWKPDMELSISPATASLCEKQAITIRVQYDKNGPKPMFRWFKNKVQVPGITADTLVVKDAATYTVQESYCSGPFEAVPGSTEINDAVTTSLAVVDVSCGQSNGSVALTVSKGKAPYTFNWMGPDNFRSTKEDVDGLAAGTYKVEIRDAAGCLVTLNAEVKLVASTISATATVTNASCAQDNGAIALNVTGGTAPYTFTWTGPNDFSSTQKDIDEIAAGAYKVVVHDAAGCTATLKPEVAERSSNLTATAVTTGSSCGEANGAVKITATGGKSPYSYRIGNGTFGLNAEFTGLPAGSHSATVRDDSGCAFELKFTIASLDSDLSATDVVTDASCGGKNGSIALSVTGGKTPYTFTWTGPKNFSSTKEDVDALLAGIYKVEIRDAAGCTITLNPGIKQGSSTLTATAATTGASCGQTNGVASITVSGGMAPYTYRLGTGPFDSKAEFRNLSAGSYTVMVKDVGGCTFEVGFVISSLNSDLNAVPVVTPAACGLNNGAITLTVSGGKAPYTFDWTGPGNFSASRKDIDSLDTGTYQVIMSDALGCTVTVSAEVKGAASTLKATAVPVNAACGLTNGSVRINASGGTRPYSYRIGNGAFGPLSEFNNLATGSYTATVRDAANCTLEVLFTIRSSNSDLSAIADVTNASCGQKEGAVVLTVTGGTAPFTYSWMGPNNFSTTEKDIDKLAPGIYKAVVEDAAGCTVTTSWEVKSAGSTLKASAATTDAACGQVKGSASITVSSGTAPYTYSLDAGEFVASSTFKDLSAGSYTVTARDATGCTAEVKFTIAYAKSDLNVTPAVTDALCEQSNGAVVLTVTGDKAPFTFSWTGPNGFTALSKDLQNLPAGVYKVDVQDALGCPYTLTAEVKKAASTLSATATTQPVACGGTSGIVQITASDGTAPYTYSLDNGPFGTASRFPDVSPGSHKVVVKDKGGCLFEVVFTIDSDNKLPKVVINDPAPLCTNATADLTAAAVTAGSDAGLQFTYWKDTAARTPLSNPAAASAGTYYIKGAGQNGCAVIQPVHVSINTTPVGTITPASASVCTGGSALLTASTGTAYQWYYNDTIIPSATGATYSAAKAGTYNVFISDGNCLKRASNTVVVSISAVDAAVRILGPATVCEGTVQLLAGTGAAHQWYRDGVKLEGDTSDRYTASRSGRYTVRVTNQQGCTAPSRGVMITVLQKPSADFAVSPSCAGEPVNFKNLSTVANSGAVTYLWNFAEGQASAQRSPNYIYREPGNYEVSLTVTQNACPQNVQTVTKRLEVKNTIPGTTYGAVNAVAGVPFALEARAIGFEYNWTPADGLNNPRIRSPKVNISRDQTYIIEIKNVSGCITRDTVQVKVQHSKVNAYVPTAFTPNGNGQNDRLRPILFNIPKLTYFKVYNRWGQLVFQTSQMGEGWDGTLKGKEQPAESYRWILECVDASGETIKRSGTALLIK